LGWGDLRAHRLRKKQKVSQNEAVAVEKQNPPKAIKFKQKTNARKCCKMKGAK